MNAQSNVPHPLWIMLAFAPLVLMLGAACTARPAVLATDLSTKPQGDGLTMHFSGQITNLQSEKIVLLDAAGTDHTFSVADDATIMLNGTEASLDMLQMGLLATVHAESRGGAWIAMSVDARQQY
jgi:hypothetical protein